MIVPPRSKTTRSSAKPENSAAPRVGDDEIGAAIAALILETVELDPIVEGGSAPAGAGQQNSADQTRT